jgi:hypothetical protein
MYSVLEAEWQTGAPQGITGQDEVEEEDPFV